MSSDRLSFNQFADSEDDGARWEAYLALQRRIASHSTPDVDEGMEDLSFDEPPEPVEATEAESPGEIGLEEAAVGRPGACDPFTFKDLSLVDGPEAEEAVIDGLGPMQRAAPPPRHGARLVVATLVLAAGFVLAMALVLPHQRPAQESAPSLPPAIGKAEAINPDVTAHSAPPGAPSAANAHVWRARSRTPTVARAVIPERRAPATPSRHQRPVRRLASLTHDCRGCRRELHPQTRHQEPQCWTPVPSLDYGRTEMRMTDCPTYVPPAGSVAATWPWQVTPQNATNPAGDGKN